ncbi:MAG: GntR family transcriptional regulator, partial [Solirubrobacteraceae bacterium]
MASGRYRQGDRLAPEHEVAAMLGVSRGTLRSALQRLEDSGEIVRRQGSGTFVGRMAVPAAFGERLELLEPYSSVAARRGLTLAAIDIKLEHRAVGGEAGNALGLSPTARATTVSRTLVADGAPVAVMFDVVHPDIELPSPEALCTALEHGRMVLDVLIEIGVPVTYAQTRVNPALLTA